MIFKTKKKVSGDKWTKILKFSNVDIVNLKEINVLIPKQDSEGPIYFLREKTIDLNFLFPGGYSRDIVSPAYTNGELLFKAGSVPHGETNYRGFCYNPYIDECWYTDIKFNPGRGVVIDNEFIYWSCMDFGASNYNDGGLIKSKFLNGKSKIVYYSPNRIYISNINAKNYIFLSYAAPLKVFNKINEEVITLPIFPYLYWYSEGSFYSFNDYAIFCYKDQVYEDQSYTILSLVNINNLSYNMIGSVGPQFGIGNAIHLYGNPLRVFIETYYYIYELPVPLLDTITVYTKIVSGIWGTGVNNNFPIYSNIENKDPLLIFNPNAKGYPVFYIFHLGAKQWKILDLRGMFPINYNVYYRMAFCKPFIYLFEASSPYENFAQPVKFKIFVLKTPTLWQSI